MLTFVVSVTITDHEGKHHAVSLETLPFLGKPQDIDRQLVREAAEKAIAHLKPRAEYLLNAAHLEDERTS